MSLVTVLVWSLERSQRGRYNEGEEGYGVLPQPTMKTIHLLMARVCQRLSSQRRVVQPPRNIQ